jgi:hypothetical protein
MDKSRKSNGRHNLQIEVFLPLPIIVFEEGAVGRPPRIVDKNVNPTELRSDTLHGPAKIVCIAYVRGHTDCAALPVLLTELPHELVERLRSTRHNGDVSALSDQHRRNTSPHACSTPGDQGASSE